MSIIFVVVITCGLLVLAATILHCEVLNGLNTVLPRTPVSSRTKLLLVIIGVFIAHAAEVALYGCSLFALDSFAGAGILNGVPHPSLATFLYFSAETYTSLGFGDLTLTGPARLLAGAEALHGLLLIGWSTAFTYISMERFWNHHDERRKNPGSS